MHRLRGFRLFLPNVSGLASVGRQPLQLQRARFWTQTGLDSKPTGHLLARYCPFIIRFHLPPLNGCLPKPGSTTRARAGPSWDSTSGLEV